MPKAARIPRDHKEPPKPETAAPQRAKERSPRQPLGRRGLIWLAVVGVVALILVLVASRFDEYLRRNLEAKMNQHLKGYMVSVGHAHLNPFSFSLTLQKLTIRQQVTPHTLHLLRLNSRLQDFRPAWTFCSKILLGGNKHIETLQRSDGFEGRL